MHHREATGDLQNPGTWTKSMPVPILALTRIQHRSPCVYCLFEQLSLVERQLEAGASDSDTGDLQQLKENLSELISLTEGAVERTY